MHTLALSLLAHSPLAATTTFTRSRIIPAPIPLAFLAREA